jgi:hypothetical protein
MTTHHLKVWSEYMDDLINGSKTFELRFNDRNFQVGDLLHLREFDRDQAQYLKRELLVKISYILDGSAFDAIKKGFVVMAIKPV